MIYSFRHAGVTHTSPKFLSTAREKICDLRLMKLMPATRVNDATFYVTDEYRW
jgi:hypothetical protein